MWLDNVLDSGSYMRFEILMQMVMISVLSDDRCSIFLLKVGVQVVIMQNDIVVMIIIFMLVIMMFQLLSIECMILFIVGW